MGITTAAQPTADASTCVFYAYEHAPDVRTPFIVDSEDVSAGNWADVALAIVDRDFADLDAQESDNSRVVVFADDCGRIELARVSIQRERIVEFHAEVVAASIPWPACTTECDHG